MRDVMPSFPAQYVIDRYLSDSEASQDALEGLLYKKLARESSGEVVIEPVVDFLVRSALSSDMLWIVRCADTDSPALILRAEGVYMHIRRYPHITDAWRITPYQNKELLLEEFDEQTVLAAMRIDKNGDQELIDITNDSWMEANGT